MAVRDGAEAIAGAVVAGVVEVSAAVGAALGVLVAVQPEAEAPVEAGDRETVAFVWLLGSQPRAVSVA